MDFLLKLCFYIQYIYSAKHTENRPTKNTIECFQMCCAFKNIHLKHSLTTSAVCSLNRWMSCRQTLTVPASCCVQLRMISEHQHHLTSLPAVAGTSEGFIGRRFIGWLGQGRGSIGGTGEVICQEDRDYSRCA